jgi:hypothetical protein
MFVGHFCPPGSGYVSRDPIGSRSTVLIIRQRSKFKKTEKSGRAFSGDCKLPLEAWDKDMNEIRNGKLQNSTEQEQFEI